MVKITWSFLFLFLRKEVISRYEAKFTRSLCSYSNCPIWSRFNSHSSNIKCLCIGRNRCFTVKLFIPWTPEILSVNAWNVCCIDIKFLLTLQWFTRICILLNEVTEVLCKLARETKATLAYAVYKLCINCFKIPI